MGEKLNESARDIMFGLRDRLQKLNDELDARPTTLEELKDILSSIARIREMSLIVDFELCDIVERYRTLKMYGVAATSEENALSLSLSSTWDEFVYRSKCVDVELTPIKRKFTKIIIKDIGDFKENVANLNKVKNELEGLTMIYDLYARQVETRDEWAQTLWANLNVSMLTEGIEKGPKEVAEI